MKLRYQNTHEDLLGLWLHLQYRTAAMRRATLNWRLGSAGAAVIIFGCALQFLWPDLDAGDQLGLDLIVAIAWYLAWPWLLRRNLRRHAEASHQPTGDEIELEIQPDALYGRSPGSELRTEWSHVSRIVEDGPRTYVHLAGGGAHVIPAAGVREGDYAAFVQALRERLAAVPPTQPAAPPPTAVSAASSIYGRVVGAILLLFGLGLLVLAVTLAVSVLRRTAASGYAPLIFIAICAAIAAFCLTAGYRLALNRPTSRGALLGPVAWRITGAAFLIGAIAGTAAIIWKDPHALHVPLPLLLFGGLFAWLCWQASLGGSDEGGKHEP